MGSLSFCHNRKVVYHTYIDVEHNFILKNKKIIKSKILRIFNFQHRVFFLNRSDFTSNDLSVIYGKSHEKKAGLHAPPLDYGLFPHL